GTGGRGPRGAHAEPARFSWRRSSAERSARGRVVFGRRGRPPAARPPRGRAGGVRAVRCGGGSLRERGGLLLAPQARRGDELRQVRGGECHRPVHAPDSPRRGWLARASGRLGGDGGGPPAARPGSRPARATRSGGAPQRFAALQLGSGGRPHARARREASLRGQGRLMLSMFRRIASAFPRAERVRRYFLPYVRPHLWELAGALVLGALVALTEVLRPWPLQVVFDFALGGPPGHHPHHHGQELFGLKLSSLSPVTLVGGAAGAIVLISAVGGFAAFGQTVMLSNVGQRVVARIRRSVQRTRAKEGSVASRAGEALSAIAVLQAFGATGKVTERFERENRSGLRSGLKASRLEAVLARSLDLVTSAGVGVTLALGAWSVRTGRLSPGGLLVFFAYQRTLYRPIRQ